MSKKSFKKVTKQAHVIAEVSKVINAGKPDEKKLYNIYKMV